MHIAPELVLTRLERRIQTVILEKTTEQGGVGNESLFLQTLPDADGRLPGLDDKGAGRRVIADRLVDLLRARLEIQVQHHVFHAFWLTAARHLTKGDGRRPLTLGSEEPDAPAHNGDYGPQRDQEENEAKDETNDSEHNVHGAPSGLPAKYFQPADSPNNPAK
jgi:hypothetical protein